MPRRKAGRPRTRREDLVSFSGMLTPEAKRRLLALAQVSGKPAYVLLEDAFWLQWKAVPSAQRDAVETIVAALEASTAKARAR
jgi:hypothetical protein